MITTAFFNNKGGVGKTWLVYHLAWVYSDLGCRVVMVDLDPQANLSALCMDEDRFEELWAEDDEARRTVYGAVYLIKEELGDVRKVHVEDLDDRLGLIVGDIQLSAFEAKLSEAWPKCMDRHMPSYRATTAFHRVIQHAAQEFEADLVLINVGPNLGALNRAALIAAEWVVTPLGADLFSIQGLRNLGPTLNQWRQEWCERRERVPDPNLDQPNGEMQPAGYVVMQPNLYGGTVTRAYEKWLARIPEEYANMLLASQSEVPGSVERDPACLAVLKHYRSLMALAHEARKPIFHLQNADGALGSHATAAREVRWDFANLAQKLADKIGLQMPIQR